MQEAARETDESTRILDEVSSGFTTESIDFSARSGGFRPPVVSDSLNRVKRLQPGGSHHIRALPLDALEGESFITKKTKIEREA